MKIFPLSDIHAEFHQDGGAEFAKSAALRKDVDVLVVAGDCGTRTRTRQGIPCIVAMLEKLCDSFPHVVYVMGNHEYYMTSSLEEMPQVLAAFAATHPNFHWLHRSTVEIDGHRFLGTTLWFRDDPTSVGVRWKMNDFDLIPHFASRVFQENAKNVEFLRRMMKPGDVVVTHHLPTHLSVPPEFKSSPLTAFYVTDMSKEVLRLKPTLWVHGHAHHSFDYRLGQTRIVANPFGYIQHGENVGFDWNKVVEI